MRKRVGGARTYRGLVGTTEILGGLQASQYELGMHTILSARFPYEPYSLGALTPPTWSTYARIPIQSREVPCTLVEFNFQILNDESSIITRILTGLSMGALYRCRSLSLFRWLIHEPFEGL